MRLPAQTSTIVAILSLQALVNAKPIYDAQNAIIKRTITGIACGLYSTADEDDVWVALGEHTLQDLVNKDANAVASVNGKSCSRVACENTSGVYVCNDSDDHQDIKLSDVIDLSNTLLHACGNGNAVSGQIFTDVDYNVEIGFCNNKDDRATPPADYTPPGPNGPPAKTCGGNNGTPCEFGGCNEGTIVADSQETVTCYEYLGADYISAGATYAYATTREIGTSWTVGGGLGINIGALAGPIAQAGFSISYSETATTGKSSTAQYDCGEGVNEGTGKANIWTCTMNIRPQCLHTKGHCEGNTQIGGKALWETLTPLINEEDGLNVSFKDLCVCKNCLGWADPGAPQTLCNLDCSTCKPPKDD